MSECFSTTANISITSVANVKHEPTSNAIRPMAGRNWLPRLNDNSASYRPVALFGLAISLQFTVSFNRAHMPQAQKFYLSNFTTRVKKQVRLLRTPHFSLVLAPRNLKRVQRPPVGNLHIVLHSVEERLTAPSGRPPNSIILLLPSVWYGKVRLKWFLCGRDRHFYRRVKTIWLYCV